MADGSPQTIDRIQVEFSTNLADLMADLGTVDQKLQSTTEAFGSAEASSQKFAATVQTLGSSAAGMNMAADQAVTGFSTVSASVDQAGERLYGYTLQVTGTGTALSSTTTAAAKASAGFETVAESTGSAATALEKARSSSVTFSSAVKTAGTTTTTAATSVDRFRQSVSSTGDVVSRITVSTGEYADATESVGESAGVAVTRIGEYTQAADTQVAASDAAAESMKTNASETMTAMETVKAAFTGVKKLLGLFGASVGIGMLIGQLKDLGKEAENAGKMYGKLYNAIYYTIGGLTESQKELANTLVLQFDSTKVAETVSRLTALFPTAESTILEDGRTALQSMAEEVLWLDTKGYGDVSSIITGMNDAFKKWKIPAEDTTLALSYLRATYQDTNVDLETQLKYLAQLDEAGTALGMTYRDMADFIGAAMVSGNIEDLATVGTTFETQYGNKFEAVRTALLENDRDAVTAFVDEFDLDSDRIGSMFGEVAAALALDSSEAKAVADEYATELTQDIFQAVNRKAAEIGSKTGASSIWRNFLGLEGTRGGRIANALADFSLSGVLGYTDVKTANREKVEVDRLTTTNLVLKEKGLGVTDIQYQNEAVAAEELKNTPIAKLTPTIEQSVWEFNRAGTPSALSRYFGTSAGYEQLFGDTGAGLSLMTAVGNPLLGAVGIIADDLFDNFRNLFLREEDRSPTLLTALLADIGTLLDEGAEPGETEPDQNLAAIGTAVSGVKDGIDALNASIAGMHGDVYITQNFYTQAADSYTIRNAAALAVNASQARSVNIRA